MSRTASKPLSAEENGAVGVEAGSPVYDDGRTAGLESSRRPTVADKPILDGLAFAKLESCAKRLTFWLPSGRHDWARPCKSELLQENVICARVLLIEGFAVCA
jgi:hypothetical protein